MLLRPLFSAVFALGLATASLAQGPAISTEELMEATALDAVFSQFGPGIEAAPAEQGVPLSSDMQTAWTSAAREVFAPDAMHDALAAALEDKFEDADYAVYVEFYGSDFGRKITGIERTVTMMPPDEQLGARDLGLRLATEAAGTRRAGQIEEMLELVSADISNAMIRQSMRGMLVGMWMNGRQGDITVPWEEIDEQLNAIMPGIEADVAETQRAMTFYAYRDLSEAELDTYLDFLRTEAARKFYAVAAYSIGKIIADRMEAFGETLSRKLSQVNV